MTIVVAGRSVARAFPYRVTLGVDAYVSPGIDWSRYPPRA